MYIDVFCIKNIIQQLGFKVKKKIVSEPLYWTEERALALELYCGARFINGICAAAAKWRRLC